MKYKRLPYEEFKRIYFKVPRAGADVIVVSNKGFLLTKRAIPPFKGMWHIPGGAILFKEPIEHAIGRIVYEELGVKVDAIKQLGVIENLNDGGRHTISNAYLANIKSGELKGSKQGKKFKFFKKVPQNAIPEQKRFLNRYMQEIEGYLLKDGSE